MKSQWQQLSPFARRLLLIAFLMSISQSTMSTTYPALMSQFHVTTATVQWLTTGFMVAMTLVMPLSPWLMANIRLKVLLNSIVGVFMVASILAMIAPAFSWLILGRLGEGVAVGALFPTFQSLILTEAPKEKRGATMGMVGLVMGSALAVGPIISGVILQIVSWRALFAFFLLSLAYLISTLQSHIPSNQTLKSQPFDFISAGLLIGFATLLYAINLLPTFGPTLGWWGLIIISIVTLGCFAWRQFHLTSPFLNLSVLKVRGYIPAMLLTGISYSGLITATIVLPLFYQRIFNLAPLWSGLLLVPAAFILSRLNPYAGKLLDHYGLRHLIWVGMSLQLLGYGLLATWGTSSLIVSILGSIALESGNAFTMMPAVTAANNVLPPALISHGTAIITTLRQIIGAASIVILSSLITFFNNSQTYRQALQNACWWMMLFPCLGLLLSMKILNALKHDD